MIFNSFLFILFLLVMVFIYKLPLSWKIKKLQLLLGSYIFYAVWNPPMVALIWLSTLIDWISAKYMSQSKSELTRKLFLMISILSNLVILFYFKYGDFLLQNFIVVTNYFGLQFNPASPSIILPIGISFYTFQTMSYTIDVYRKKIDPSNSFLNFALYVTFFPQLVAGPIVRANEFLPQCQKEPKLKKNQFSWGVFLLTFGLFQKSVLADAFLAPVSEAVFSAEKTVKFLDAWMGVFAFSGQIFFDFAGYSLCAIGVALMFGFYLPNNFQYPYGAVGFIDFWHRWHISLSNWIRDYVYISLGGNRKGKIKEYMNLIVAMLLCGLWHGASWTFVVWGGIHGVLLTIDHFFRSKKHEVDFKENTFKNLHKIILTFVIVSFCWVFFRATDFGTSFKLISSLLAFGSMEIPVLTNFQLYITLFIVVGMILLHTSNKNKSIKDVFGQMPNWAIYSVWVVMLILLSFKQGAGDAFIYFSF